MGKYKKRALTVQKDQFLNQLYFYYLIDYSLILKITEEEIGLKRKFPSWL